MPVRTESRRAAKKRGDTTQPVQPPPGDSPTPESTSRASTEPPPSPESSSSSPSKLAVVLRDDGTIDVDGMRSSTKERLRKALADKSLGSRLGLELGGMHQPVEADAFFGPAICGILYDTSSKLMIALALKSGYPPEQALSLAFTKEEIEQLTPLTGKVLDKWIPIGGKYQDEAMLALMLFSIVNGKIALMRKPAKVVPMRVENPAPTTEGEAS